MSQGPAQSDHLRTLEQIGISLIFNIFESLALRLLFPYPSWAATDQEEVVWSWEKLWALPMAIGSQCSQILVPIQLDTGFLCLAPPGRHFSPQERRRDSDRWLWERTIACRGTKYGKATLLSSCLQRIFSFFLSFFKKRRCISFKGGKNINEYFCPGDDVWVHGLVGVCLHKTHY